MLRATNTGVTAAIDGDGRVIAALAPHVAGSLDVRIQGTDGLTPFARAGNTPAIAAALLLVAAAGLATRSRAGSRGQTG
jgi:apolipoprotein N-acyltransferase